MNTSDPQRDKLVVSDDLKIVRSQLQNAGVDIAIVTHATELVRDFDVSIFSADGLLDFCKRINIKLQDGRVKKLASNDQFTGSKATFGSAGKLFSDNQLPVLASLFLVSGIIANQERDVCWDVLGQKFARSKNWQSAKHCFEIMLEVGAGSFYRYWHAAIVNFAIGEISHAQELLALCVEQVGSADEEARVLPLKAIGFAANEQYDEIEKLCSGVDGNLMDGLPEWIKDRNKSAFEGMVLSAIATASKKQQKSFDVLQMRLPHQLTSPEFWHEVVLADPDNVDNIRRYLSEELKSKSPKIDNKYLAVLESQPTRNAADLPLLIAGYVLTGRNADAIRLLTEEKTGGAKLRSALESACQRVSNKGSCLELIEVACRQNPKDKGLQLLFGLTAYEAGQQQIAAEYLLPLATSRGKFKLDSSGLLALGIALQMTNQPKKAIEILSKIAPFDAEWQESRRLLQRIAYQVSDFKLSVSINEEFLMADSMDIEALIGAMFAARAMNDHRKSCEFASRLVSAAENGSDIYYKAITVMATEAALSGSDAIKRQANEKILSEKFVQRANWNTVMQMVTIFVMLGNYQQAFETARKLHGRNAKSPTILRLVALLQNFVDTRKLDPIPEFTGKATNAVSAELHLLDAQALAKVGRIKAAIDRVVAVQEGGYASDLTNRLLANYYLEAGYPKKAIPQLKRLLKINKKDLTSKNNLKVAESLAQEINAETSESERESLIAASQMEDYEPDDSMVLDLRGSPQVSIVVPCYNEARFLADCLNSVWMQTNPFWECIIVDDVSSDISPEIAKAYCNADPRFKYIRHDKNKGLAGSRNTGLAAARAPYVTFLDSDDYITLDSINSRLQVLEKNTDPFIAGVYCKIRSKPEHVLCSPDVIKVNRADECVVKNFKSSGFDAPFNAHAPLIKKIAIDNVGGFTESMRHGAEDWDCWQRMMRKGYYFEPSRWDGGFYRQKRGSMVRSLSKYHVAEAAKMYRRVSERSERGNSNGPYEFIYPTWVYQGISSYYQRALRFAAMAHMSGDLDGFNEIVDGMPGSLEMCDALKISTKTFVKQGVERFLSNTDEVIGTTNRRMFKENATGEINEKIRDILSERPLKANIENFFPVLQGKSRSRKTTARSGSVAPNASTGHSKVPSYVKLEESNAQLADSDRLKKLQNIHAGERVFIVGNGPSLNKIDLSKLENEYSIAVNGIFYKTEQSGYKPTYYVVEDTSVFKENIPEIIAYDVEKKFFPTIYSKLHPHDDNTYFFRMNRGFYEPKSPNYCVPRFSTDFAERAYCGQSVTFINLQLAFYMGFTEVYLIGMDFSYVIPKNFERKGDIITSTDDDPNHFHPDYFGKGKTWKDPKLDRVLANYQMAKLAYETSGRKIYNATAGGKLELFERRDFDSLFK